MPNGLRVLTYISCSELLPIAPDQEVRNIVAVSQANNRDSGITGFLVYTGDYFVQILEGRPSSVGELLLRLQVDTRHKGLRVLSEITRAEREFSDWTMACPTVELSFQNYIERLYRSTPSATEVDELAGKMRALVS